MIEFLLQKDIERRVKNEVGAVDYYHEPVSVTVASDNFTSYLDNAIYFLVSTELDVPITSRIVMNSPDNFFSSSKTEYDSYKHYKTQSFRNKINIKTQNYGDTFIPYKLEFIKVTPILIEKSTENGKKE